MSPKPIDIVLHRASHVLEVAFDDGNRYRLPCEYLRVESPSAEVQGHGPGQKVLVPGKRNVNITAIDPMGNYAVLLHFDDGHASGIFTLGHAARTRARLRTTLGRVSRRAFRPRAITRPVTRSKARPSFQR